jgi:NADH-quinone oxidoreductase subunit F
MALTPVLSRYWDHPRSWTLDTYRAHDGYRALQKALTMEPDEVIESVKSSGLRGRGGAGFPTGAKWSFIPQDNTGAAKPHYLVINADESEPGTCKDVPLMMATPHVLIEGAIIAAYAIRARHTFIYIRGEVVPALRRLQTAVSQAYAAGFLGADILGSGYHLDMVVHAGAGAYICGEETALLDSLEGRRGQPRLRPPFPAEAGLYGCPTVVNNVESVASVPSIILNGVDWFRSMGTEDSPGFTIYSLSGHINRPGQYEAPLGTTLRELLEYAGGVRDGHRLKFWTPGGSSTPILTAHHLDVPLHYEGVSSAGSMLGTKALQIFDETTCVVRAVRRWTQFYAHESCGKCTPCREGTYWLTQVYEQLESGAGTTDDRETRNYRPQPQREVLLRVGRRGGQPHLVVPEAFRRRVLRACGRGRLPIRSARVDAADNGIGG